MDTIRQPLPEHRELAEDFASRGVKYAVAGWIDVLGRPKSKIVPIGYLPQLIAGSERYTPRGMGGIGNMNPLEDEGVAIPDPSTSVVLPWDRRFLWMAADLYIGGREPYALCPRSILQRQVERAADMGYQCQLGVEPEFYVFRPERLSDGRLVPIAASSQLEPSPAYDVQTALDSMPFLDRMCAYMEELEFGLFSFDVEGGDGQYEFDFAHAPVLQSADRMTLFRLMARQTAAECGLAVTFMPKPYANLWGSGAHFNMSLEDLNGKNIMRDDFGANDWSKEAHHFVAGILRHARALTALANPTTNSYRRLVRNLADGQVSWAPTRISYGHNNRSCMLRLPANRPAVENRAVDSAANTYLTAAFMLAAGLEGIKEGLDPGEPLDDLGYDAAAEWLPRTLLESIEAFDGDPLTRDVFHDAFVSDYVEMKRAEWEKDHLDVTDRERDAYLLNL